MVKMKVFTGAIFAYSDSTHKTDLETWGTEFPYDLGKGFKSPPRDSSGEGDVATANF